jgi:hypothetical protein
MEAQRPSLDQIGPILERARAAAVAYYRVTGKPLGITGEVGEYEAARLLDLSLADAREPGFDAVDRAGRKYQIKSRAIPEARGRKSRSVGQIKLNHEWDAVLLVLLDEQFRPTEIWAAERPVIIKAIQAPGSRARNERGALAVSKFKSIGRLVWPVRESMSLVL